MSEKTMTKRTLLFSTEDGVSREEVRKMVLDIKLGDIWLNPICGWLTRRGIIVKEASDE